MLTFQLEGLHLGTNGPFIIIVPAPRSQEAPFCLPPHLPGEGRSLTFLVSPVEFG